MNNSPLLSIIVPVYNVELYLKKCIDSILSQTFYDFELILVDDGSTDKSGDICNDYAKLDNRVVAVHRKNNGVSSSRNYGLEKARGKYVTFVDSDDEISQGTLKENMDILLNNEKIDILQYPYFRIKKDKKIIKYATEHPIIYSEKKEIFIDLVNDGPITWTVWGKIFKNNVYKKLFFYEAMHINEDLYALLNIIDYIECFCLTNVGGYLYYYREGSACNSVFSPYKILDLSRTGVLKFQKALKYNVDGSKFWSSAVKSCIDAYAYLGPTDELKNFLKLLYYHRKDIILPYESNVIVKLSKTFSPLAVARTKRIKYLMFRIFCNK